MKKPIIEVKNLSKEYIISHNVQPYYSLRDSLAQIIKKPFTYFSSKNPSSKKEKFLALNDVNFSVMPGEVIGIIGKNGAGKSTLLKILSQITPPTKGSVHLRGRVASLLEVGTGFHPELTGRENVFLNGAILGMTQKEIKSKFDEIVDFSGVEKFIDTPVKRYSSGMYVRLAFAVAAHLEPEILIVDEVLSVGDAEFQKKCLGKMDDISKKDGRTVLLVSHNMETVKKLCKRGILLENGMVKMEGNMTSLIDHYLGSVATQKSFTPFKIKEIDITVTKIALNEENDGKIVPFQPLKIDIEMEADRDIVNIGINITISHEDTSGMVFSTNTKTTNNMDIKIKKGKNTVTCLIESFNLCSGKYWLGFGVDLPFVLFYYLNLELLSFDVPEISVEPRLLSTSPAYGHVYLKNKWVIEN